MSVGRAHGDTAKVRAVLRAAGHVYAPAHLLVALLVLPVLLLLLPVEPSLWLAAAVVALGVATHLSQELYRLLVASDMQLTGSTVLVVRSVSWIPVAGLLASLEYEFELVVILSLLVAAEVGGGLLAMWRLTGGIRLSTVQSSDLRFSFRSGGPALLAAGLHRATLFADRALLAVLAGAAPLAQHGLLMSLALAVQSLIEATVVAFLVPRIYEAVGDRDGEGARRLLRTGALQCAGAAALFAVGAYTLFAIGGDTLSSRLLDIGGGDAALYCLLGSLLGVAMIPHLFLLAGNRVHALLSATAVSAALGLALVGLFAGAYGHRGALLGLVVFGIGNFVLKSAAAASDRA